jgi:hypothetical protein
MDKKRGMAVIFLQMEMFIKEFLDVVSNMEKVYTNILLVIFMKDNTIMTTNKATV